MSRNTLNESIEFLYEGAYLEIKSGHLIIEAMAAEYSSPLDSKDKTTGTKARLVVEAFFDDFRPSYFHSKYGKSLLDLISLGLWYPNNVQHSLKLGLVFNEEGLIVILSDDLVRIDYGTNRTWGKKSLLFQVDFRNRPRATGRIAQIEIKWSSVPKPSNMLTPVMIKISFHSTRMRLTSSAITKAKISSLTCRNISGSSSNSRALLTPDVKCETTTSQSSSTSLQDRKVPVVSKTRDSTRKKPSISWVNASREDNGRGVGRIRSDWA